MAPSLKSTEFTLPPLDHFAGDSNNYVTAFAILRSNGQWDSYPAQGCHGAMSYAASNTDRAIMTAAWVNKNGDKEASEEYWNFMLDKKESPWRSMLGDAKTYVLRNTKGEMRAIGFDIPKGVIFGQLMNFLIASRTPWERPEATKMWKDLWSKQGFTKTEALFIVAHVAPSNLSLDKVTDDMGLEPTSTYGHWAYDAWSYPISFKNYEKSVMNTGSAMRYGRRHYGGINVSWHSGKSGEKNGFVKAIWHVEKYDGIFKKLWVRTKGQDLTMKDARVPRTYKELVKIAKESRSDWN